MLTALLGKQSQRGAGGLPVCPGIQANDEAVSTQWVWGGVKDVGSWAEKQPSKPPWLAALAFSASFPVGSVTAAGHPPPQPQAGTLPFFCGHTARRFWAKGDGRLVLQLGIGTPDSWPSSVTNLLCDLGQVISPALSLSPLPLKL